MKVIQFPPASAPNLDLAAFLRNLADEIEHGEFSGATKLFGIMECTAEDEDSFYVTFSEGGKKFTKLEAYGLIQVAGHLYYNAQFGGDE